MSVVNVKVANIRPQGFQTLREWMKDPNHVYIGRGGVVFINGERFPKGASQWANPYKVTKDCPREKAIELYEAYIRKKIQAEGVNDLLSLKGKCLGCWCSPEPCHGDVLLKLLEEHQTN